MFALAALLSLVALGLMIAGITHRSIIMERSPIGNLYDTILFIGATGVLVLLLVELLTRRAVSLGLAVFMGMACMFLARRYEIGDAKDHMDPLVAVLKSNFWLSTHVTTVTMGYAAGLLAAGIAHVYLFGKLFGFRKGDKSFYKTVTDSAEESAIGSTIAAKLLGAHAESVAKMLNKFEVVDGR